MIAQLAIPDMAYYLILGSVVNFWQISIILAIMMFIIFALKCKFA